MRGRMKGKATRGNVVTYGQYGLQALEPAWIKSNHFKTDRSSAYRHDEIYPQRRSGMDKDIPRQACNEKTRRNTNGFR